jgi:hypothetical protein
MKKTIIILSILAIGIFFLWTGYLWKYFSCSIAGSDPCAEYWDINTSESNLIKAIVELKNEHPELNPPNEPNSIPKKRDYWYDFTFHYSDTNEDVQTWVRGSDGSNITTIAFIATFPHIDSLTPISEIHYGNRKEINRDYSYFENKKQISKFEHKIIDLIRQKIKEK